MTDLLRLLLDLFQVLSPFRIVPHWCKGLYLVAGRYQRTVGPGLWPVVPGLCDVKPVSVVPAIHVTPLQSVTLRDGSTLTFQASITVVVTDPAAAYLTIDHYQETIVELTAALLGEGLADADPDRFDPAYGKRGRLLEEQRERINETAGRYGLAVTALRLGTFVRGVRTVRLLVDAAGLLPTSPARGCGG